MNRLALAALIALIASGCSLRKLAVNQLGEAIAAGGSTFASDDDPELVGDALPFTLKLMESLLAQSPDHHALLVAAARGFTQYANGWVEPAGDEEPSHSAERSKRLYLRARDYGMRALEGSIHGFRSQLAAAPVATAARASRRDVPALYWTAAAWGLAISHSKDDLELIADLPIVEALIFRAAALEPDFDDGAIDNFLISYEAALSGISKEAETRAREHLRRAIRLSDGHAAAPFVTAAEALAVPAQDRAEFEMLLNRALSVDIDARPEWRLANIISQRRARWLLEHAGDYFLTGETDED